MSNSHVYSHYLTGMPLGIPPMMAPAMAPVETLDQRHCNLIVCQQPQEALVSVEGKEKSRKPIDPPPIVELKVNNPSDPGRQWLQSPYFFVVVDLIEDGLSKRRQPGATMGPLTGTTTSSLHRLKDSSNNDGGFMVLPDISVTIVGTFQLRFSLFELQEGGSKAAFLASVDSDEFNVVLAKDFKGMAESSVLSRSFSDQGVRLRLRKEPRGLSGNKRKKDASAADEKEQPDRQNQKSDPSSYDETSSPVKRYKYEIDDRKDSLPAVPHTRMNSSTYNNPSINPSMYAPIPSYTSPNHSLTRQNTLPSPANTTVSGYSFSNIGLQGNFPRTSVAAPQQYQQRLPVASSPALYNQQMYQDSPSNTMSNGLSHNSGYSNDGNMFRYVGQRSYPSYPDNNDFDVNNPYQHGQ